MRIISAQSGDVLMDEQGIKVTVLAVKNDQVSIKVEVPDGMSVTREELVEKLFTDKENVIG